MSADHKTMTTAQIREDFISFFVSKGCKHYPSSSLIPDDPSLLLTNAGMNQFKEYYQGKKTMQAIGATTCQKCLRTNDIENIGDSRHLSFFEMLGNFSFGGYSKADAIAWAYEFVTSPEHLGLPAERLYMTVFEDDEEAIELWHEQGVPYDHISRLGEEDNFWAAGPTGPCGPCSEIYYDQGPEFEGEAPGDDGDRFLEFWNLVFTQYDRQEDGSLPDLPQRNVDTGMGLERIAAIMQYASSNYEGDLLRGLIRVGEKLANISYGANSSSDRSLRILADHSRAVSFLIADGVLPSNEGRGYVLRRLLRRAVFHGRLLGIEDAFLHAYVDEVIACMGDAYPELKENETLLRNIVAAEEARFTETLGIGRSHLDAALSELKAGEALSGATAFTLHDTYGFPIELTCEISEAAGYTVDMEGFHSYMEEQRARGRAATDREAWSSFNDVWVSLSEKIAATDFVGYESNTCTDAHVQALVMDQAEVGSACTGDEVSVVVNATPFYAEMGGQISDTGSICSEAARLEVIDVSVRGDGLYAHNCIVREGTIMVGDKVSCSIDVARRELIRRNHTATHLLDAALKQVLGDHVNQAGSLVSFDRLRFDFTHFEALTQEQLAQIEALVNAQVFAHEPVATRIMALDDAKREGAIALFGEKYEDEVRVVSVGDIHEPFSCELCGGTHVSNTSEIGFFKIVSEGSVGANLRRIEAVTSAHALEYVDKRIEELNRSAAALHCAPLELHTRIEALSEHTQRLETKLAEATRNATGEVAKSLIAGAIEVNGYRCVIDCMSGINAKELRGVWDSIRDSAGAAQIACVLASETPDGKVALLAAGTADAVESGFNAGAIIGSIAEAVGGRGGGRPAMAQAGGKNAQGIQEALTIAREWLQ